MIKIKEQSGLFGELMSPVLLDIESAIHEFTVGGYGKPCYKKEALRSATVIFTAVLMDKIWELQDKEDMDMEIRRQMAQKCGEEVRKLVKVYTDIDTYSLK